VTATPIYDAVVLRRRFSSPYYVFQHADDSWERRMSALRYSYALGVKSPADLSQIIAVAGLVAS
jgi:hypothetical protein